MLIKLAKGVATGNLKNLLWLPNLQQFISRLYGLCFLDFGLFGVAFYRLLSQSFSQAEPQASSICYVFHDSSYFTFESNLHLVA